MSELPKRNIKDSVFTSLFRDTKYVAQLYKVLHPEENISEDLIDIVTLQTAIADSQYNDLGFTVDKKMILLIEAQTNWSVNIIIRILVYLAQTYNDYITKEKMNVHSSRKIDIPKPELYVIYTGNKKIDKEYISLSEEFFNGELADVEVKVRIICDGKQGDIINQYVAFTHVCDEQFKEHGRTLDAIREVLRICKEKDILKDYLSEHESEVYNIMITLFDQEQVTKAYAREEAEKAMEKGIEKGKLSDIRNLMNNMKLTAAQAMAALSVPESEYAKYENMLKK